MRSSFGTRTAVIYTLMVIGCSRVLIASGTLKSAASRAGAQDSDAVAVDELIAMAEAAKSRFQPVSADRAARAQARLKRAMEQLDRFLATGGAANGAQWKKYLLWSEMRAELGSPGSETPVRLGQWIPLYYRDHASLEHPRFAEMRAALLDYRAALGMAADTRLDERYVTQLDALAQQLTAYERERTMQLGQTVGALLAWLEMAGQAPDLVAAIRHRYGRPNLYSFVSERMVNAGFNLDVDETQGVEDCILGTAIRGTATMKGTTRVEFMDNTERAQIRLHLTGTIHSDNVGHNRGVQICSQAETQVRGTKIVHIDAPGLTSEQSQVSCDTQSTINGIGARSCLVEKIAWKRVMKSKSTAEQIGSQRAEERVASGMEQRAAELLQRASGEYLEKFRNPLLRRDEFPRDLRFQTIKGLLRVVWRQANAGQLAAPDTPPPLPVHHDLGVQVHESFVSNFSRAMLAGVRLTDERLAEILEKNFGEVPEALRPSDDADSWAITFALRDPVSAVFSANTVRFAIRGQQFKSGQRVVKKEMEMSAVYRLEKTPGGVRLQREGDVSVEYVGVTGRIAGDDIPVRTVMRKKFEALFQPEFETTGIKLPGRWADFGTLHLQLMMADGGWLQLAWTQAGDTPAVAQVRSPQGTLSSISR